MEWENESEMSTVDSEEETIQSNSNDNENENENQLYDFQNEMWKKYEEEQEKKREELRKKIYKDHTFKPKINNIDVKTLKNPNNLYYKMRMEQDDLKKLQEVLAIIRQTMQENKEKLDDLSLLLKKRPYLEERKNKLEQEQKKLMEDYKKVSKDIKQLKQEVEKKKKQIKEKIAKAKQEKLQTQIEKTQAVGKAKKQPPKLLNKENQQKDAKKTEQQVKLNDKLRETTEELYKKETEQLTKLKEKRRKIEAERYKEFTFKPQFLNKNKDLKHMFEHKYTPKTRKNLQNISVAQNGQVQANVNINLGSTATNGIGM